MRSAVYPLCLEIRDRLCVVVGGGEVAHRKVIGLLAAGARVRMVSPAAVPELAALAEEGRIEWRRRPYAPEDLQGALLVFAATDDRVVQGKISRQAATNGQLVNVADDPDACNFQVPACLRRGDLTVAVATNGRSPAVAALVRSRLEEEIGAEYEVLLRVMAQLRPLVLATAPSPVQRKKIYKKILHGDILDWIRQGEISRLRAHLLSVLGPGREAEINALTQDIP